MFGNQSLQGFEYKGYTYGYDLDYEDDNCKTNHFATRDGETIHFDWSPYSNPTEFEFKMWVDLGCPERITNGPLRYEHLREILVDGYKTFKFDLKSMTSDWSRSGVRLTARNEEHARQIIGSTWRSCEILNFRQERL